ncbi:MAG: c-type cytochrome [Alphaproteobacteria bacterium]|nr:c-type cytochrome [Alphaproteobacteria bacterium]
MRWNSVIVVMAWSAACSPGGPNVSSDVDAPPSVGGVGEPPQPGDSFVPGDTALPDVQAPSSTGRAVQLSADGAMSYVLDEDLGAVVAYGERAVVQTLELGVGPTRIAGHEGSFFVTLRGAGEVVRLETLRDGTLAESVRAEVGAEPFGVAGLEATGHLYVALSQERAVVALDPVDLSEVERWTFDGEPRWVTSSHPADAPLVVIAMSDRPELVLLDPTSPGEPTTVRIPTADRFADGDCRQRQLQPRITGDPVLTPANAELLVPGLHNDTQLFEDDHAAWRATQVGDGVEFGEDDVCEDAGEVPPNGGVVITPCKPNSYACIPALQFVGDRPTIVGKFNPTISAVDVAKGEVDELILINGLSGEDALFGETEVARGVPAAVAWDHVRGQIWVAMQTMSTVVVMSRTSTFKERTGSFQSYRRLSLPVEAGPSGIAVSYKDDTVSVWSMVGRALHRFTPSTLDQTFAQITGPGDIRRLVTGKTTLLRPPASPLSPDIQEGRRLFFGADERRMSGPSAGVSCSACHPDGRGDHLVWHFEDFSKQAPMIAGDIHDTAPFRWDGVTATAKDEIVVTAKDQMGGEDLTDAEALKVVAFLESLPRPQRPTPADAALVAQGETLFGAAGCDTCHAGTALTDTKLHRSQVDERDIDTPSLRGVGATGPYGHDGSVGSLDELLSTPHAAGADASMTAGERAALVAYLSTL